MPDKYENFAALAANEMEGVHYRIHLAARPSPLAVLAPHGGHMEPGSRQIAQAIAGARFSFYCFESLEKRARGQGLHITSTRFDEPRAMALLAASDIAIGVHGRKDKDDPVAVWVGGLHEPFRDAISDMLERAGFAAKPVGEGHPLSGRDATNICNRGRLGAGVQLEMPARLRQALVADAAQCAAFVAAIHRAFDSLG